MLQEGQCCVASSCQDLLETIALQGDFLHKLRESPTRDFLKLRDGETQNTQALEENFAIACQLVATFAPERVWPPHSLFKVPCTENASWSV